MGVVARPFDHMSFILSFIKMEIHWRAPLQPKGFLKIIEMVTECLHMCLCELYECIYIYIYIQVKLNG